MSVANPNSVEDDAPTSNIARKRISSPPIGDDTETLSDRHQQARCSCESLSSCFKGICLEPVMFVQNIVSQLVFVSSQDLMMDKACLVNHQLSPAVCSNLPEYEQSEEMIHDQVSEFMMWRGIFETTIKFMVVLFMGPWSDRFGRRLPLILLMLFLAGEASMMLLNYHMTQWPLEMMMICSIPYSLSGGHYALLMLTFAHTANTTTNRRRTFRMGFLDTFWYFGKTIGLFLKPVIKEAAGYGGIFISSIILYIVAAIYVFFRLRGESIPPREEESKGCCEQCRLDHFHDSIASVTKKRPNRGRFYIIMLIIAMMFDGFINTGEGNVRYLFVRQAVNWSSSQYSNWYGLTSALSVIGGFILFPIMTFCYDISDCLVGMAGSASRTAANLAYATVNTPGDSWLLYLGSCMGSFTVLVPVVIRSMLSKVAKEDVGSVFAVMAAGESLVPYICDPLYQALYTSTDTHHPGAYNFFSALINVIIAAIFLLLMYFMRPRDTEADAAEHQNRKDSCNT